MTKFKCSIKTKSDVQKILTLANRCSGDVIAVTLDGYKRVNCRSTLGIFALSGESVIVEVYDKNDAIKFVKEFEV